MSDDIANCRLPIADWNEVATTSKTDSGISDGTITTPMLGKTMMNEELALANEDRKLAIGNRQSAIGNGLIDWRCKDGFTFEGHSLWLERFAAAAGFYNRGARHPGTGHRRQYSELHAA